MPRTQSPTPARATSRPAPARDRSSKNLVSATRIADSRPSAVAQRALSEAAKTSSRVTRHKSLLHAISGSPVVMRQRAFSEMVRNSPRVLQQKASADALQGVRTEAPEAVAQLEPKPNRTGLPDQLKTGVESLSGMSLDGVKVHYNSAQPAQLNALAYAQGSDIHVGPGQEKHLPHEAWHVVQQAQGRVKPTMQMKGGVSVNNDSALESEADVMGAKALQMKGAPSAGGRQEVAEACPSADRSGVTQLVRFMM